MSTSRIIVFAKGLFPRLRYLLSEPSFQEKFSYGYFYATQQPQLCSFIYVAQTPQNAFIARDQRVYRWRRTGSLLEANAFSLETNVLIAKDERV